MSRRSDILSNIHTTLEGVTGIGTVNTARLREIDIDTDVTLPAAFADFGDDRRAEAGMGFEGFVVPVDVEVWVKDADRETFISRVHTAMMTDVTRGGYALNTTRNSCKMFFLDPGRSLTGFVLSFDILYRHPTGSP